MNVLVFNVGSTTLKYACVDTRRGRVLDSGCIDQSEPEADCPQTQLDAWRLETARAIIAESDLEIHAVGHRIVQGGSRFSGPTQVTPAVLSDLERLDAFAPLHNPAARKVAEGLTDVGLPQVLVFDTSYYSTLAPQAYRYAVPDEWFREHGVRKYGFHGTSHEFVTKLAIGQLGGKADLRCISLHLGGGASATASLGGRAVDTSMGMTPLQGLVMATRSGDIDPAIPLLICQETGESAAEVQAALNERSGLVGLCGDSDMRTVMTRHAGDDDAARLAVDIYVRRIVKTVGSFFAVLGGLDALIFTVGVGERSPEIRKLVSDNLGCFGVSICQSTNAQCNGTLVDISDPTSKVKTLVVPTNEELAIATKVDLCINSAAQ